MKNLPVLLLCLLSTPLLAQENPSFQEEAVQVQLVSDPPRIVEEEPAETSEDKSKIVNFLLTQKEKADALEKEDALTILRHKPMYFAYGNPSSKLQFSFKSPIVESVPFYFAYSQIIFWKLREDSKPFQDATYNPEFLYTFKIKGSELRSINFGIWEHNSNGQADEDSRSFDRTYVQLNYATEATDWITEFNFKASYMYNLDRTNEDLYDYIGPFELTIRFIQLFNAILDKSEVSLDIHPGGRYGERWDRGGYQLGMSFRLGGLKLVPAFYLQYYHGYAETLINYDQRVDQLRGGFIF